MENSANNNSVNKRGCYYFKNGYHCAEAVAASVLEKMDQDPEQAVAHATAFGGGFCRSFQETCGALSGALIVIGHCYARKDRGASWDEAAELGAIMRNLFIKKFGTTHCKTLRERFGQEQSEQCARLSGILAADLYDLLQEKANTP